MRPHPHKRWTLQYPSWKPAPRTPALVAKKFYLEANRLYARTSALFIRTRHLPPQSRLNDRELQLQEYCSAECQTRGNGSPIHGNPQQVFTFSATDEVPGNTVIDDVVTEFGEPWTVQERELEGVMVPGVAGRGESAYQRMVDRTHRRLVQRLVGPRVEVDMETVFRMERSVSAQGF